MIEIEIDKCPKLTQCLLEKHGIVLIERHYALKFFTLESLKGLKLSEMMSKLGMNTSDNYLDKQTWNFQYVLDKKNTKLYERLFTKLGIEYTTNGEEITIVDPERQLTKDDLISDLDPIYNEEKEKIEYSLTIENKDAVERVKRLCESLQFPYEEEGSKFFFTTPDIEDKYREFVDEKKGNLDQILINNITYDTERLEAEKYLKSFVAKGIDAEEIDTTSLYERLCEYKQTILKQPVETEKEKEEREKIYNMYEEVSKLTDIKIEHFVPITMGIIRARYNYWKETNTSNKKDINDMHKYLSGFVIQYQQNTGGYGFNIMKKQSKDNKVNYAVPTFLSKFAQEHIDLMLLLKAIDLDVPPETFAQVVDKPEQLDEFKKFLEFKKAAIDLKPTDEEIKEAMEQNVQVGKCREWVNKKREEKEDEKLAVECDGANVSVGSVCPNELLQLSHLPSKSIHWRKEFETGLLNELNNISPICKRKDNVSLDVGQIKQSNTQSLILSEDNEKPEDIINREFEFKHHAGRDF
jgi:hypothetical protein